MIRCKRRKDIRKMPTEDEALKNIAREAKLAGMGFRRYIMRTARIAKFKVDIKPVEYMMRSCRFQRVEPGILSLRPTLAFVFNDLEFLD